jgi:esterase
VPETRVNGIRLYHEEHGEGRPILCIHGGGSTAVMWEEALPELARLGRVIAYDRRGCSRSERPERYERTSVGEQADDAAALLDALGATRAVVIGRSYGGAVAVELALRRPDLVGALALLEGDALGLSPTALDWTRALRGRLIAARERDGDDAVYAALIGEVLGPEAWDSFPAEVCELLSANGPALLAELGYVNEPHPGPADFASIGCPVLLVAAEGSPLEQRQMSQAMARVLPDATLVEVGGGHLVNPAAAPVLEFIRDIR